MRADPGLAYSDDIIEEVAKACLALGHPEMFEEAIAAVEGSIGVDKLVELFSSYSFQDFERVQKT